MRGIQAQNVHGPGGGRGRKSPGGNHFTLGTFLLTLESGLAAFLVRLLAAFIFLTGGWGAFSSCCFSEDFWKQRRGGGGGGLSNIPVEMLRLL